MRPCDLAGERKVVVGDVGLWVPGAVLELHLKAATELLGIDLYPVDPEHGTEVTRFLHIDLTLSGHDLPPNGGHLEPCVRAVRLTAFSTSSLAVTGSGSLSPATRPRPSRRRGLRPPVRSGDDDVDLLLLAVTMSGRGTQVGRVAEVADPEVA